MTNRVVSADEIYYAGPEGYRALRNVINVAKEENDAFGVFYKCGDENKTVYLLTGEEDAVTNMHRGIEKLVSYKEKDVMLITYNDEDEIYILFREDGQDIFEYRLSEMREGDVYRRSEILLELKLHQLMSDTNRNIDEIMVVTDLDVSEFDEDPNYVVFKNPKSTQGQIPGDLLLPFRYNNVERVDSVFDDKLLNESLLTFREFTEQTLYKRVKQRFFIMVASISTLIASIFLLVILAPDSKPQRTMQPTEISRKEDKAQAHPYQALIDRQTRDSVNIKAVADTMLRTFNLGNALPGWNLIAMRIQEEHVEGKPQLQLYFERDGGIDERMFLFVNEINGRLQYQQKNMVVYKSLDSIPMLREAGLFHHESFETLFLNYMSHWYWNAEIATGQTQNKDGYLVTPYTISIPEGFADDVATIGSVLYGRPFEFASLEMQRNVPADDKNDGKALDDVALGWKITFKINLLGVLNNVTTK